MKGRTVHLTWMAFTLAAVGMLGLQNAGQENIVEQHSPVSYTVERNSNHAIQPVSLPVVSRQVNQAGPFAKQRQTWTF